MRKNASNNRSQKIIDSLRLTYHPEGGYYRRTYKNDLGPHPRGHASAIYYPLEGGGFARNHKLDADELWLWHVGAPPTLEIHPEGGGTETSLLCLDGSKSEAPQHLIPRNCWQRALRRRLDAR